MTTLNSPSPQRFVYGNMAERIGGKSPENGFGEDNRSPFRFDKPARGLRSWSSLDPYENNGGGDGLRQRKGVPAPSSNVIPPPPRASLMSLRNHHQQQHIPFSYNNEKEDISVSSPSPTVIPHNHSPAWNNNNNNGGDDLSTWVFVIYGDQTNGQQLAIEQRFESYGTILRKYTPPPASVSPANWICFQYKSRFETEKALSQHGSSISINRSSNNNVLLGVTRMDSGLAARLGIPNVGSSSGNGLFSQQYSPSNNNNVGVAAVVMDDESILLGDDDYDSSSNFNHNNNNNHVVSKRSVQDGLMYRILSWVYMWG